MSGMPVPTAQYFPKLYRDAGQDEFNALTAKLDKNFLGIQADIDNMRHLRRIEKQPRAFTDEFGYLVAAGIVPGDTDRVSKTKAYYATRSTNSHGTWADDAKKKIDSIALGNSSVIASNVPGDAILYGGGSAEDATRYCWTLGVNAASPGGYYFDTTTDNIMMGGADDGTLNAILGTDGIGGWGPDLMAAPYFTTGDNGLGIELVGAGTEPQIPGNIYINVDNSMLTSDQISAMRSLLADSVPAYFRVYLCYLNDQGNPVVYTNGVIG